MKKIIGEYSQLLKRHGPNSPEAVKVSTRKSQYLRFKILTDIADLFGADKYTILEYGCGLGDMLDYLEFQGFRGTYIGIDINPDMVKAAKLKHPGVKFLVSEDPSRVKSDFCFISGVFNEKIYDNPKLHLSRMKKTIKDAFKRARFGVAINGVSEIAKKRAPGMFYVDSTALVKWCLKNVSPYAVLRHDYRGGNFTIYIYRDKGVKW